MKEWVIIIGTLLILIILIDGIRRKRNERYGAIKVASSLNKRVKPQPEYEPEPPIAAPTYGSELPNGGARVIGQRNPNAPRPSIEKRSTAKSYLEKQNRQELLHAEATRRSLREPEQASFNLGQSVPMLMDSVQDAKARQTGRQPTQDERIEPSFRSKTNTENAVSNAVSSDEYEGEDFEIDDHPYERELSFDREREEEIFPEGEDQDDSYEEDLDNPDAEQSIADEHEDDQGDYVDDEPEAGQLTAQPPSEPEEVLIINIMAFKGEMFNGSELLDIVLKCGMRYGSLDIFHRYSDAKGEGTLLFSMANMVKPGTFDLDAMDEFETPGVSLFMTLPLEADSMQSFDCMLETAQAIAEALDGELKDEQRSVMTRQTIEHCRQRIRDFERKRLFRRPR